VPLEGGGHLTQREETGEAPILWLERRLAGGKQGRRYDERELVSERTGGLGGKNRFRRPACVDGGALSTEEGGAVE